MKNRKQFHLDISATDDWTIEQWGAHITNMILAAGGTASTAFFCAALFCAGLEKRDLRELRA